MIPANHPRALGSPVPAVQELEPMLLAPDHAQPQQRVNELVDSLQRFSCEPFADEVGPVAERIYAEAYSVACLPEPNSAASSLARLRGARLVTKSCVSFRQADNSR